MLSAAIGKHAEVWRHLPLHAEISVKDGIDSPKALIALSFSGNIWEVI
jgi:hypothetical protein